MSPDRQVAEALSNGLNCLHAIAAMENGPAMPDPTWAETLEAMERAMEAIQAGAVMTSIRVSAAALQEAQRLRSLVVDWSHSGMRPANLAGLADALYHTLYAELAAP